MKWTLGVTIPATAFVVVTSAVRFRGGGAVLAAALGALAFPGVAAAWHVMGERRRRRGAGTRARATSSPGVRWLLRTWGVAVVAIGATALVLRGDLVRAMRAEWPVRALFPTRPSGLDALSPRTRAVLHLVPDDANGLWIADQSYAGDLALVSLVRRLNAIPLVSGETPEDLAFVGVEGPTAGAVECTSLAGERPPYPKEDDLEVVRGQPTLRIGDMVCRWPPGVDGALDRARAAVGGRLGARFERVLGRLSGRAFFVYAALGRKRHDAFQDLLFAATARGDRVVLSLSVEAGSADDLAWWRSMFLLAPDLGRLDVRRRLKVEVDGMRITGRVEISEAELETLAAGARAWLPGLRQGTP